MHFASTFSPVLDVNQLLQDTLSQAGLFICLVTLLLYLPHIHIQKETCTIVYPDILKPSCILLYAEEKYTTVYFDRKEVKTSQSITIWLKHDVIF